MTSIFISDDGFDLRPSASAPPLGTRRPLDTTARSDLDALADRYRLLERQSGAQAQAAALAIGRDLYRWVDGPDRQLERLLDQAQVPLRLTIHCPARCPSPAEWALLHTPWELLADGRGFLAADPLLGYSPLRRLGPVGVAPAADDHRLGLAFMAAAPLGQAVLDFEREEAAILAAVGELNLDLLVEESGEAQVLGRRLADAGGLQVVHLSAHGHSAWRDAPGAPPRPVLLLEDGDFGPAPTDAAALLGALSQPPRLLFLSACLSAALPGAATRLPAAADHKDPSHRGQDGAAPQPPIHSLTTALIQAGLPAILGWDGSVADPAATSFAATLYRCLADRRALAVAVADARRALLDHRDPEVSGDWHLARLWLGPAGDGAAALVGGPRKRSLLPASYGGHAFLGKQVPVAAHAMFVGRRAELQRAIRALDGNTQSGVLLLGMGRLGKSSLAARIVNRRRDRFTDLVLWGRFGIDQLLERLAEALEPYPVARSVLEPGAALVRAGQPQGQEAALVQLRHLLTDLLTGPCQQADAQGPALLLVLDDFEQMLQPAAGVRPLLADRAGLIRCILEAFDPTRTDSRLLITSRFPFRLDATAGQTNPVARLARIDLRSFDDTDTGKLALRQGDAAALALDPAELDRRRPLLPRALAAARGNPGLLDLIGLHLVLNAEVPVGEAERALAQMEAHLTGGSLPEHERLRTELEQIAVDALLHLAGAANLALLRALTLFRLPVPSEVADRLAADIGGSPASLADLALLEPALDPVRPGAEALRVSPLAAGRLAPLTEADAKAVAAVAAQPLFAAWGGAQGSRPGGADLELARIALAADDAAIAAACGAAAVRALEAEHYGRAAELGQGLLSLLGQHGEPVPPRLAAETARVLAGAGHGKAAQELLDGFAVGREPADTVPTMDRGHLLFEQANRRFAGGDLDHAEALYREVIRHAEAAGQAISVAVARGKIADILQARGQLDEALRIRTEEQLPVYERLGDVRSLLVGRANLAILLLQRARDGDRDEANRLLCLALGAARGMDLPEAGQIEGILDQAGMGCDRAYPDGNGDAQ